MRECRESFRLCSLSYDNLALVLLKIYGAQSIEQKLDSIIINMATASATEKFSLTDEEIEAFLASIEYKVTKESQS